MQPLIAFVAGGYSVPPGTLTVPRPDAECERLSDEPRGAFIRADRAGRRRQTGLVEEIGQQLVAGRRRLADQRNLGGILLLQNLAYVVARHAAAADHHEANRCAIGLRGVSHLFRPVLVMKIMRLFVGDTGSLP